MTDAERIVRAPLSVELIRKMDELVLAQKGGLRTRAEFIKEAVEALVLELSYESAPAIGEVALTSPRSLTEPAKSDESDRHSKPAIAVDASLPELSVPISCRLIRAPLAEVEDAPLFGLHNRDYPTIWAASVLANLTQDSLVPVGRFYLDVTTKAWDLGRRLQNMTSKGDRNLAALFPTNAFKPQSAEEGFRAFALGRVQEKGHSVVASGPLFQWKLCQLEESGGELSIGLTEEGFGLLRSLAGIAPAQPHSRQHASHFLGHLRRHSPEDWWGFKTVLDATHDGIGRLELIGVFSSGRPDWTDKEVPSYTAGYVARCREWGLLEPRQDQKLYRLTGFGEEIAEEWRGDGR